MSDIDISFASATEPLQCEVTGEDSPESALRQVDEHALLSMYCTTGCDYAVNHAVPHAFSTYLKPSCYVEKQEHEVEYKKYNKDDKNDRRRRVSRWGRRGKRDIDAYTVGSATVKFCCSYQGQDYTVAAAKRIGWSFPSAIGSRN